MKKKKIEIIGAKLVCEENYRGYTVVCYLNDGATAIHFACKQHPSIVFKDSWDNDLDFSENIIKSVTIKDIVTKNYMPNTNWK